MKINKLIMSNFGIYAGKQEIDFSQTSKNKPIILLGGYNGRGKTTILEAILLCLYGNRSYAMAETRMSYQRYLTKFINKSNGNNKAGVELFISVEIDSEETQLRIIREWIEKDKFVETKLKVYREREEGFKIDSILTDHWENQMEYLMPVGMSRLFLFDGEKVAELVDDMSEKKLKAAIKTLLGIDVIEQLDTDIHTIINRNHVTKEIEKQDDEITALRNEREKLQAEVLSLTLQAEKLQTSVDSMTKQLLRMENKFSASGGKLLGRHEETKERKEELEHQLRELYGQIYEKMAGYAPLLLVMPLLNDANYIAKTEFNAKMLLYELNGVEKFVNKYNLDGKTIRSALNELSKEQKGALNQLDGKKLEISAVGGDLLERLTGINAVAYFEELQKLINEKNNLLKSIDEVNKYLSVEVDTESLSKLLQKIREISSDIGNRKAKLERIQYDIEIKIQASISIENELNKKMEAYLTKKERQDNAVRLCRYGTMARNVLADFRKRVQGIKVKQLSKKITEKFLQILGKRTLIHRVEFDEEDLSMRLYDEIGNEVNRKQLSAGEQQLLATSIVWGIVDCTEQEFPMIIDTPLARLDTAHRELFVKNYLPNAGSQVIVLSTDAEISNDLYDILQERTAREYLLEYDELNKSSHVIDGYFEVM